VVEALGPAFAVGFAVQQVLEIVDPVIEAVVPKNWKKTILGLIALAIGLAAAYGAKVRVLGPLGVTSAGAWDPIVTGVIVSAGTQGFNSVMKFLGYAKENKKAAAEQGRSQADLNVASGRELSKDAPVANINRI
jgi:hypothetical protein